MSQAQRSTVRSAVTNESFAVRQRVAPGPHGDRPGSHAGLNVTRAVSLSLDRPPAAATAVYGHLAAIIIGLNT